MQKQDADGIPARKKARIAAGDLVSRGEVPDTYSANLAGRTSLYRTQSELQMEGGRTTHRDVGGACFHGRKPPVESPRGGAIFARIQPGWAGLGTEGCLCFEETQEAFPWPYGLW